jgi:hypothetical protein
MHSSAIGTGVLRQNSVRSDVIPLSHKHLEGGTFCLATAPGLPDVPSLDIVRTASVRYHIL